MRMMICGGSPCPVELMQIFIKRGVVMTQGWGMTEASPMATFLTSDYAESKVGSAGAAVMFCDVRLVDPGGKTITESHVEGEAYVRGPNVMKGYWNNPTESAAVLSEDGWFKTGDIAYRDDDGFFYIVDRAKDMIISGAENIYPAEIERVLLESDAVSEAAVVGVPDERWGERPRAEVVLNPGVEVTEQELLAFVRARLAGYKCPGVIGFRSELPRNASGKVRRDLLRAEFGSASGVRGWQSGKREVRD
jgi:fatty-acyl-CoA synthase